MNRPAALLCLLLITLPSAKLLPRALAADAAVDSMPGDVDYSPRFIENRAFGPGERLVFSVEYGIIKAGTATLSVSGPEDYDGLQAYRIVATACSNPAFSSFFRVEDTNEALLDIVQLHTLMFHKHLEEGSYRFDETVYYDQEAGYARYPEEPDSAKALVEIPPHALDVLSSLYYARTLPLEVGEVYYLDCHADNDNYPLKVTVLGEERIRVPAGEFDCILVQPELSSPGIFEQKGELYVWLTDDEARMPVLMRSAIVIGEIATLLQEYTPGTVLEVENPFESP
ncbi:DUF3108 domain-containing protein [Candidatus Fermentibacterales bacterium]|nr:DUF3108 domain-containing protein [Candidatus Fermentibacterales bacterium]